MGMFSDEKVEQAIASLSARSTEQVRDLIEVARRNGLARLEAACERELAVRPVLMSEDDARRQHALERKVSHDTTLCEAIEIAFKEIPVDDDELNLIRWIAANPGEKYTDAARAVGKGHTNLVTGYLAKKRFGCFRRWLKPNEEISNIILVRSDKGDGMRYTLRPEAVEAFTALGLLSTS